MRGKPVVLSVPWAFFSLLQVVPGYFKGPSISTKLYVTVLHYFTYFADCFQTKLSDNDLMELVAVGTDNAGPS